MDKEQELKIPEGYEGRKVKCQEILLYESHAELKLPNGMTRAISLGDFITTLAKTMNQETSIKTTLLPANCYVWGQTLTEMKLACYYPGKVRKVEHLDKQFEGPKKPIVIYEIPFPNIIISHILKKRADYWEHSESRYFGTSKPVSQLGNEFIWVADHKLEVWALPLGNVYPEGRLCYGGNSLPKGPYRESFRGLDWHFAVLYSSSFNDDLNVPSLSKGSKCKNWYEILKTHKTFPYELLAGGRKVSNTSQSVAQQAAMDTIVEVVNTDMLIGTADAQIQMVGQTITQIAGQAQQLQNEVTR